MATLNRSFQSKIDLFLDSRIGRQLREFEQLSACAGLRTKTRKDEKGNVTVYKDESDNINKARINHYGGHTAKGGYIPPRPFIDEPLKDTYLLGEFEDEVARILSGGRKREYTRIQGTVIGHRASQMTSAGGPSSTLNKIASSLVDEQRSAIIMAQPRNADSTIARKKKDSPLRNTYDMFNSLEGWVE